MHHLDLRNLGLTEVPSSVFDRPDEVEVVDLSGNDISELPEQFSTLRNLKIAFFSNNRFAEYPSVLAQCPKLSMVSFKENQLQQIDEGALSASIRWLILTNNQLRELPDDFGKLQLLEKLALSGNQLKSLPDGIKHCRSLGLARISANQLEAFPEPLLSLPQLAWLAFDGNPFVTLSEEPDLTVYQSSDFDLQATIGQGASGIIQKAQRKSDGKPVAIKFFKGELTSDGNPADEMRNCMAAGLHPNLVELIGRIDEPAALIFDLIPSQFQTLGNPPNLDTCTRDTFNPDFSPTLNYVKTAILSAASAVAHLHKNNLTHGDIYAHNLMTNESGHSILADYGAASSLQGLSAEQIDCLKRIEARAIGCLVEDLLSQCPESDPFLEGLQADLLNPDISKRPLPEDLDFKELASISSTPSLDF